MLNYNFDTDVSSANYEIKIDTEAEYGYFEHNTHGDEIAGGLWFEGLELIDYDGVFELPYEVIESLKLHDIDVTYVEDSFDVIQRSAL
jgi:hypothetical protein